MNAVLFHCGRHEGLAAGAVGGAGSVRGYFRRKAGREIRGGLFPDEKIFRAVFLKKSLAPNYLALQPRLPQSLHMHKHFLPDDLLLPMAREPKCWVFPQLRFQK